MILDNRYTVVPQIKFTLTYDNGTKKTVIVKTRDIVDCTYKRNSEICHIIGCVTKISCNFNSSLGSVGTTAYMQIDGSSEYKGQVQYVQPSQVLNMVIISTTEIVDNIVCSVDIESQKITLIRENEVGAFQYSLDGINWKGITANQGKSAYECAVALGYEGTEEDWLNSLKGDPGTFDIYKVFESISDAEEGRFDIPTGKVIAVLLETNTILFVRNGTNMCGVCEHRLDDSDDTPPISAIGYDYLGKLEIAKLGFIAATELPVPSEETTNKIYFLRNDETNEYDAYVTVNSELNPTLYTWRKLGITGKSGVYYGTDEPTDPDVNVWIDPTGDAELIGINDLTNEVKSRLLPEDTDSSLITISCDLHNNLTFSDNISDFKEKIREAFNAYDSGLEYITEDLIKLLDRIIILYNPLVGNTHIDKSLNDIFINFNSKTVTFKIPAGLQNKYAYYDSNPREGQPEWVVS